jgi:hypothetical protein
LNPQLLKRELIDSITDSEPILGGCETLLHPVDPIGEPTDEEVAALFESVISMQETLRKVNPIRTEWSRMVFTNRPIGICFPSDLHIGNEYTDHRQIIKDFDLINSCPYLFAYLGGDGTDNFVIPKLAHAARGDLVRPSTQWLFYRYLVKKLLPSLLAVGDGNHTAWTFKLSDLDGTLIALRDFPTLYTYEGGYLDLTLDSGDGRQTYTIFRKHRPRFGSAFNLTHTVKRLYEQGRRAFDVGVIEHQHSPVFESFNVHSQERIAIRTGTYKVFDPHAEEYGYYGGGHGVITVVFFPNERRMVPFRRLEEAIAFLNNPAIL